jgi:hypothetical protein
MTVRQLWRLWALLMMALVLAWLTVQPSSPAPTATTVMPRQPARLPEMPALPQPVDARPIVDALAQSTLWGPPAPRVPPGGAAAPPPPKWSLSGFYEAAGTRFVVLSYEALALPSRQLKVGDRLPDGRRLQAIEPDRVRVGGGPARRDGPAAPPGWIALTPGLPTRAKAAR